MSIRKGDNLIAGSVNYDAALESYTKAVELGKREIAQALIDKGADVTANSSLIEMADATKLLHTDEGRENYITKIPVDFYRTDSGNERYSYVHVNNQDLLFYDNSTKTIYYVRKGFYNTFGEAVENAISSYSLEIQSGRVPNISLSQNEQYLIVDVDDNKLVILNINTETGTITLNQEITTTNTIYKCTRTAIGNYGEESAQFLCISNDKKIIAWKTNVTTLCVKNIDTNAELTISMNNIYKVNFLEKTKQILCHTADSYAFVFYDFEKNTIGIETNNSIRRNWVYFNQRIQRLIQSDIVEETHGGQDRDWLRKCVWVFYDEKLNKVGECIFGFFDEGDGGSFSSKRPIGFDNVLAEKIDENTYKLVRPQDYENSIIYHTDTNIIEAPISLCIAGNIVNDSTTRRILLCCEGNKVWYSENSNCSYFHEGTVRYANGITETHTFSDKVNIGFFKTHNNSFLIFSPSIHWTDTAGNKNLIETGLIDLHTTKIEL